VRPTRKALEDLGEEVVMWTEGFTVDSLHALHAKIYQLIHQHRLEWDKAWLIEVHYFPSPTRPLSLSKAWLDRVGLDVPLLLSVPHTQQDLRKAIREHPSHSQSGSVSQSQSALEDSVSIAPS
jgi:hypothetical protein